MHAFSLLAYISLVTIKSITMGITMDRRMIPDAHAALLRAGRHGR